MNGSSDSGSGSPIVRFTVPAAPGQLPASSPLPVLEVLRISFTRARNAALAPPPGRLPRPV